MNEKRWGALSKTASCLRTWAEAVGQGRSCRGCPGDRPENAWRFDRGEELGLHGEPQVCEKVSREREGVHLQANPCEGDNGTEYITGPAPGGSPTHQRMLPREANPPGGTQHLTSSDPRALCLLAGTWYVHTCTHTHIGTHS